MWGLKEGCWRRCWYYWVWYALHEPAGVGSFGGQDVDRAMVWGELICEVRYDARG